MTVELKTIKSCIEYLTQNVQELALPELSAGYQQAISDLQSYLTDEEDGLDYEYSDNDYLTDRHPEYAECF